MIGDRFLGVKAVVENVFDKKELNYYGVDIIVVYRKSEIHGIRKEVVWSGTEWEFKNKSPSGTYVDINKYLNLLK